MSEKYKDKGKLDGIVVPPLDRNKPQLPKTAPGSLLAFSAFSRESEERFEKAQKESEARIAELQRQLDEAKASGVGDVAAIETAREQAKAEFKAQLADLEEKLKASGAQTVPVSKLRKIPGRQRNLTAAEKQELRDNMAALGRIITPIVVEPEADGHYAIIAGNNRYDNAVELGWETLPIFVFNGEPEENEDAAFYSNLMHPSLPDFEKYLGLKRIMQRGSKTQTDLVKLTGLSQSVISRLMSFDKLSEEHRELISLYPDRFSGRAISTIANDADRKPETVKAVIEQVINAKEAPTQTEIAQMVKKSDTTITQKPAAEKKQITERVFKAKKVIVAKMRSAETFIRVDIPNQSHRAAIEAGLEKLINEITAKEQE